MVNIGGDGGRKAWVHIGGKAGDGHIIGISSPNLTTDVLTGSVKPEQSRYTPLAILYTEYMAFVTRTDSELKSGRALLDEDLRKAALQALRIDRASCRAYAERHSWRVASAQFLALQCPRTTRRDVPDATPRAAL